MGIKFSMSNRQVKRKFSAYSKGVGSSQFEGQHYASSGNADTPLTKSVVEAYTKTGQAMGGGGGGLPNVMYGQPMFFSPLHTPQNWQIASKKREIYQWTYLLYTQVLMNDFTYQSMENVSFSCENLIEDTLTGGLLYENIDYPEIMDSEGNFSKPPRFSERECVDKRCFSFSAYGYWRELRISEEHKIFVLDGDLYRKKKSVEDATRHRRKVGIKPNGVKKVIVPDDLIKKVEAQNVKSNDYLLCPVPEVGTQNIQSDLAWLVGLCIADGTLCSKKNAYHFVGFTGDSREKHLDECEKILNNEFEGKISRKKHGDGNGYRVSATTSATCSFFLKYITNKGINKKFTQEIFSLDKETRLHVLAGYFDGDSSFDKKETKLIANNYSKDMADQLYWLLLSCGISCSLNKYPLDGDHYPTTLEWCYRIFIPSSEVKKLRPYMRSDKIPEDFTPKTSRELKFFYEEDGQIYFAQPISKIEQFYYTGKGYDIEMTNSRHALVADGYICSNCRFYQCFTPESLVLMGDGTEKRIDELTEGDEVINGTGNISPIKKIHSRDISENILSIKAGGINREMNVTSSHEIPIVKQKKWEKHQYDDLDFEEKWVEASEIRVGDRLYTPPIKTKNKIYHEITSIREKYYEGKVYDLELEGEHSYCVNRCVVHNSNEPKVAAGVDFYCFVPATQILMVDGSQKSISSIKKDDLVRSHDGTVNSVEEIHKKYVDEEILAIEIEGVSQDTLKVTPGHKVLTEKDGQIDFVQVGTLKVGDYLLTPINYETDENSQYSVDDDIVKGKYIYRKINDIKTQRYSGDVFDLTISNKHSYIANRIAVHNSEFPLNGFVLECKDKKILKFFERTVKRLKLNYWLKAIGFERHLLGDVYPFVEYECERCGGHALLDGTECNHPGGTVSKIKVLNPDWITVHKNPMSEEAVYMLEPDDELKGIIATKRPEAIYSKLPASLIESVSTGQPIVLSNRNMSHIKYGGSPYSAYGTSIIRRMFTYLAYKTKLMTANWIVAERLILPIRIVKLGSDSRPATAADIADVSSQLVAVSNDPNLTLVTHNNFDYSWEGACHSEDTEILTENRWKYFNELEKDEKVATYNMDNKHLEYQLPTEYNEYDYDSTTFSQMYHFKRRSVDVMVTPNHRMLIERKGKTQVVYSQDVKHNDKFVSTLNWAGSIPEYLPYKEHNMKDVDLDTYLKFIGYFVSEGSTHIIKRIPYKRKDGIKRYLQLSGGKQIVDCNIYQNQNSVHNRSITDTVQKVYPKYSHYKDNRIGARHKSVCANFAINSCIIARHLFNECGHGSENKRIPQWIKNLPKEKLQILLDALMDGDGTRRNDGSTPRYKYSTTSKQLADDVSEICLKIGYFANTSVEDKTHLKHKNMYRVYWSERRKDVKFNIRKQHIHRPDYIGKVYCVKVPNSMLIVRRNGMISVQGNSGKIHNLTNELEEIGKEILDGFMLNQAILNGEASGYSCHSEDTLTLCDSGFKKYDDIDPKVDKIACYNPDTKEIEYHSPYKKMVYDYDGEMIHFNTDKMDILVTPNHRMWSAKRDSDEYRFIEAKDVKARAKFIGAVEGYAGNYQKTIKIGQEEYSIYDDHEEITKKHYKGKVYCFEVPYGLFVTMRNGQITIQGNSAQVGIEIMIARLESWRNELAEWVENHIFLPIAMMQNFKDEEESKEAGEDVFVYPKLKWNDLQLRDRTNFRQILMQLHDKGLISAQRLLEEFDIDYDQETRRIREENALASATGQFLGQPQGGMGGMGGMPMGGGMGGGMPPMDLGGGGMPGMPGGEPGMPGAAPPGMPGAAPPAPGGMPAPMAAAQPVSPAPSFISKRGKGGKSMAEQQQEQAQQQAQQFQQSMQNIRLTTLEQKMLNGLSMLSGQIPYKFFLQYKIATAGQPQPYVLDFAYPDVGVGIETCGEIWHEQIDQKIHDQQRDQVLANIGWRILRFKEEAIEGKMPEILKVIYSNISEAVRDKSSRVNKAASSDETIKLAGPPQQIFDVHNKIKEDLKFQRIDMQDGLGHIYLVGT